MSTLIAHSPRFSSGAALMRHYRKIKDRMRNLAPPPMMALPSPEIMARGNNVMPIKAPPPKVVVKPVAFLVGDVATVCDIIPDQYGMTGPEVRPLPDQVERIAIRRAISNYFSRVRSDTTVKRTFLVRDAVALSFKIDVAVLTGESRTLGAVRPRQIGMCLAGRLVGASLPDIGRTYGGRDHTTALHSVRKMASLVDDILEEMFDGQKCDLDPYVQPEPQVLDGQ